MKDFLRNMKEGIKLSSTNRTTNYGLNQWTGTDSPRRDDFNNDNLIIDNNLKANADGLNTHMADMTAHGLGSVTSVKPIIGYGMNSKINISTSAVYPTISVTGQHYLNLLGRAGNCEALTPWTLSSSNVSSVLDNTQAVFGTSSIKATWNTTGSVWFGVTLDVTNIIDRSKYYCVSGYYKNGSAGWGTFGFLKNNAVSYYDTKTYSDTTKFNRSFAKIAPSDMVNMTSLSVVCVISVTGSGQYGNLDGVMLNEITASDYNNGNFIPPPYVDSIGFVQNPYFENRRNNLVLNGNGEYGVGYWTKNQAGNAALTKTTNGFEITSTTGTYPSDHYYQFISVRPNTDYYLKYNYGNNGRARIWTLSTLGSFANCICDGVGTFNSGNNNVLAILVFDATSGGGGTSYIDSISLTEGATAPSLYAVCDKQAFVAETTLFSGDSITIQGDKVTGSIGWKHRTLYGRNCDWQFMTDFTGFKQIKYNGGFGGNAATYAKFPVIKYDGKIIPWEAPYVNPDRYDITDTGINILALTVSDTDTGWAEGVNPTNDEVKVFMNGWKSLFQNVPRYLAWVSVIDGSIPSGSVNTIATGTNVSGQASINVTAGTGSNFPVGRYVAIKFDNGTWDYYIVASNTANNITFTSNLKNSVSIGNVLMLCDDGSTYTTLLQWCKNNVAPGYSGYRLHYQLINPEDITDANCNIHGNVWALEKGGNYVYVDDGVILGEFANPYFYSNAYHINDSRFPDALEYYTQDIFSVYKNGVFDTSAVIDITCPLGVKRAFIPQAKFDTNAVYTVDYKILATRVPKVGTIAMQYTQNVVQALTTITEAVEQCQAADSALYAVVNLSMYEAQYGLSIIARALRIGAVPGLYGLEVISNIPIHYKKTKPVVSVIPTAAYYYTYTDAQYSIPLVDIKTWVTAINSSSVTVAVSYVGTDSTIKSYVDTNGLGVFFNLICDCRGRV